MRPTIVFEVEEEPGQGIEEHRSDDLVERIGEQLGELPRKVVCSVTYDDLERIRELATSNVHGIDLKNWLFGGFVAIDSEVDEGIESFASISALAARFQAAVARAGLHRKTGWVEVSRPLQISEEAGSTLGSAHEPTSLRALIAPLPAQKLGELERNSVNVTVIEGAWDLDHVEIERSRVEELSIPSARWDAGHGLATLSVLIGWTGGLVPWLRNVRLLSLEDRCGAPCANWTDAVLHGLVGSEPGDILLIEFQDSIPAANDILLPPEIYPAVAKAIELASMAGIAVVEPAGNAADAAYAPICYEDPRVGRVLQAANYLWPAVHDSGAIIVGAAATHDEWCRRRIKGNRGRRIDLYAPGNCYKTAGWYPNVKPSEIDVSKCFTEEFGQTSGAAAIVAAGLALIQTSRRLAYKQPLLARDLRELLRQAANRHGMGVAGAPKLGAFVNAALSLP